MHGNEESEPVHVIFAASASAGEEFCRHHRLRPSRYVIALEDAEPDRFEGLNIQHVHVVGLAGRGPAVKMIRKMMGAKEFESAVIRGFRWVDQMDKSTDHGDSRDHQALEDALFDADQDVEMATLLLEQSRQRRDRAERRLDQARSDARRGKRT